MKTMKLLSIAAVAMLTTASVAGSIAYLKAKHDGDFSRLYQEPKHRKTAPLKANEKTAASEDVKSFEAQPGVEFLVAGEEPQPVVRSRKKRLTTKAFSRAIIADEAFADTVVSVK